MLSVAEVESASADEPNVQAFARKVFQGQCATPVGDSDKKLWFGRVRQVLSAMQKSNSETTYECEPEQSWKDGLCSKGALAVTILNNHPRPNWWTLRSVDDRAFVLLHEWLTVTARPSTRSSRRTAPQRNSAVCPLVTWSPNRTPTPATSSTWSPATPPSSTVC